MPDFKDLRNPFDIKVGGELNFEVGGENGSISAAEDGDSATFTITASELSRKVGVEASFVIDRDTGKIKGVELGLERGPVVITAIAGYDLIAAELGGDIAGLVSAYIGLEIDFLILNNNFSIIDQIGKNYLYKSFGLDFLFECFPAETLITLADGSQLPIEGILVGNEVATLKAGISGKVSRLFSNVTDEWLELVWQHPKTGAVEQIISTPGHVFLAPDGSYKRIIDMVQPLRAADNNNALHDEHGVEAPPLLIGSQGRPVGTTPDGHIPSEHWKSIGSAEIVLGGGTVVQAHVRSIKYAAQTAHLFEEAEMLVTWTEGGLACKPEVKKGWKTYNFEVAEHHNYIANGVHVHNESTLATELYPDAPIIGFGAGAAYALHDGALTIGNVKGQVHDGSVDQHARRIMFLHDRHCNFQPV